MRVISIRAAAGAAGAAFAALLGASVVHAGGGATFTHLGFLNPGNFGPTIPYGISADGSIVVGESISDEIGFEAFRWNDAEGMVGLGAFPNPGGFQSSQARACSADGSVIVGASSLPNSLNEDGSPFRWTQEAGLVFLGSLGGTDGGVARGVSSDGNIVVGYGSNASFGIEAFMWTNDAGGGSLVGLGDLPGGAFNSQAADCSGDGTLVSGLASTSASPYNRSFKWTQATGIVEIAPTSFRTVGVSRDGAYIVGGNLGRASRLEVASGQVLQLPHVVLPGLNGDTDLAWAANADGSVVVGMENLNQGQGSFGRAFMWDAEHGTRIIRTVLINEFGLGVQLAGWELNAATAVSDDGLTITGYGFAPSGEQAGWLVRFPHPCPADLNGNGTVEGADITFLLADWGSPGPADLDGSGVVDGADITFLLAAWGACP